MTYRSLTTAAQHAGTDEETILEFQRAGWIKVHVKNGHSFISAPDEYRCRFIVHLRRKLKLSDEEIGTVLADGHSPYTPAEVSSILARHAAGT